MVTTHYVVAAGRPPHYIVTVKQLIKRLAVDSMEQAQHLVKYYARLGLTALVSEEWDLVERPPLLLTSGIPPQTPSK